LGRFEFTCKGQEGKDDIEVLQATTTQILGGLWVDVKIVEGW